ncbi:Na(+)/dicarboxylate cotransporter 3-like [Haemaphysalis longicornis]
MMVSMFLSLWIPNTASASIMGPIAMAIADQMQKTGGKYERGVRKRAYAGAQPEEKGQMMKTNELAMYVRKMMLLSVTYACNIGGTGSLIGTAPNQIMKRVFDNRFPLSRELTYTKWMVVNVPAMLVLVLVSYGYVQWNIERKGGAVLLDSTAETRVTAEVTRKYNELGKLTFAEATVLFMTVVMMLLILTMDEQSFTGWASYLPEPRFIRASVPMLLVSLVMFVIPRDPDMEDTVSILTWEEVNKRVSWATILIISGGMSLAEGSKANGLDKTLGNMLAVLKPIPRLLVVSLLCLIASFATELASNSAVSSILVPVVIEVALLMNVHPLYYAIPVTVCCSFAFMLPAATPVNAIVYQLGRMTPLDMARPGVLLNLITVVGEVASVHCGAYFLLGLDEIPWWAVQVASSNLTKQARRGGIAGKAALLDALRRPARS